MVYISEWGNNLYAITQRMMLIQLFPVDVVGNADDWVYLWFKPFSLILENQKDQNRKMEVDRVAPAFNGRTILLTGGTGFLGKIIIEKFLRYTLGRHFN